MRFNNSSMFSNVAKRKLGKVKDETVHTSHLVCMVDLGHLEGDIISVQLFKPFCFPIPPSLKISLGN